MIRSVCGFPSVTRHSTVPRTVPPRGTRGDAESSSSDALTGAGPVRGVTVSTCSSPCTPSALTRPVNLTGCTVPCGMVTVPVNSPSPATRSGAVPVSESAMRTGAPPGASMIASTRTASTAPGSASAPLRVWRNTERSTGSPAIGRGGSSSTYERITPCHRARAVTGPDTPGVP